MYKCLNAFEREEMFKHSSIKMEQEFLKSKNHLIISIKDNDPVSTYDYKILRFSKFDSNDRVLITDLKRIKSDLSGLPDIYHIVCEKTVKRFIKLLKESAFKKIAIFTEDAVMQEVLLEYKFSILKSISNAGVVATLDI